MRVPLLWIVVFVFAGGLIWGCNEDGDDRGTGGVSGTGGATGQRCGPETECPAEGLICDINVGRCVECLTALNCMDDSKVCIDGKCEDRLCVGDDDCPADTPECTDTGCAPCTGEVVTDGEEGTCFAARGPNGESPSRDSDGCSAEDFVAALETAGYEIPSDDAERKAIADDPVKRVTDGLCSVPFGNNGDVISACELHDYCFAVCGSSRAQCNLEFAARLLETCRATYISGPCLVACNSIAVIYATHQATASDESYLNAQSANCACCPADTTDGTCDADIGESVNNSNDCRGDFSDGTSCLSSLDCESGHCSVHGECALVLCVTNGDCPSDICNFGVCLARPLAEGSGCSTDAACASDACTLGSCRECDRDDQCVSSQHCNLLGDCIDDLGNNAVCTSNAECLSGICSFGFCAECVRDDQCVSSRHCNLVGDCVNDLGNNAVCTSNAECLSGICSFGFCAECIRDSQCPSSEHCNLVGDCVDDLGNGSLCTSDAECRSGTCIGVCV